jgi:hypothetical protein
LEGAGDISVLQNICIGFGASQSPTQWVLGLFLQGINLLEQEVDHYIVLRLEMNMAYNTNGRRKLKFKYSIFQ